MGLWSILTSKNFLILTLFILATTISIWLLMTPTPTFHTIMFETHKQITSNLKNMNVMGSSSERSSADIDETYMELLGFTTHTRLYPDGPEDTEIKVPVVVTAVTNDNYGNAIQLIESVRYYFQDKFIHVYDLGLGSPELVSLQKHCNTSNSCIVKSFDFEKFPSHVHSVQLKAYKPIVIQQALMVYSAIIWTDALDYFIAPDIKSVLGQAQKHGIVAWVIDSGDSTSALTHPKMFTYFRTQASKYYFQHMVSSEHLIIYNTKFIHKELMLPWVRCSLDRKCVHPLGAQAGHCDFGRRPKYLYMGCHHFEQSSLNIILGQVFHSEVDVDSYISKDVIFGKSTVEMNITTKSPSIKSGVDSAGGSGGS